MDNVWQKSDKYAVFMLLWTIGVALAQKSYYDDLDNEMWQAYTGMTREEYLKE